MIITSSPFKLENELGLTSSFVLSRYSTHFMNMLFLSSPTFFSLKYGWSYGNHV